MQTYHPGTQIGQYEIASRPLMGGMGVVYFALDHGNDGRPVALKTFRPELLPDRAARDRFLREGTAWVELGSHPHIVRCYSVEYRDPVAFLVLELVSKEQSMRDASLRSWLIPGHPLPLKQALLFALQIARGMQFATEKIPGFVHRDLKPENILAGADKLPGTDINHLRVTDFGLAKTIANVGVLSTISNIGELKPNQFQFTQGVGTPLYMAPEQWRGNHVGVFTDVYAFGCILYEMLSGQQAASGKTITGLQASHCEGNLRPIPSNLSKDIVALLTKCLLIDPGQRWANWEELSNEIEYVYSAVTGISAPPSKISIDWNKEERMQVGSSYNAIGTAYLDMGRPDVAMNYFEKAIEIAQEVGDQRLEGHALGSLAISTKDIGEVPKATELYEQTLKIVREIGDRRGEAVTLGNLGLAYARLGQTHKAIEFHQQALAINREIGDRRGEAAELCNLGVTQTYLGDDHKAIEFHEQALTISREIGDHRGEGGALGNLGIAYANLSNTEKAIEFHEQHLRIAHEIGDRRGESNAFSNLGIAYADLGNIPKAIELHEQHLRIAREIGDRHGEADALGHLALACEALGDTRKSIALHEQCLVIKHEIGDRRGEANALSNLGLTYMVLGDMQKAVQFHEQALIIRQETKDINGIAIDSYNLALIHARQGQTTRALLLAQEAAHNWTQIGNPHAENARQLVAELQGSEPVPNPQLRIQAAFEAFQRAASLEDMQVAVSQYAFMMDKRFTRGIEQSIAEQEIPPNLKPAFEQRLMWLRQIANQK